MIGTKKQLLRERRHWRVRKKVRGTPERPRMAVCFSNENIYVQFIDDTRGVTLASTSSLAKSVADRAKLAANSESAKRIGSLAAEEARKAGISKVVFDRGGQKYHGKVKALADAARESGLQF
jgi:large subunit ribosomal protein L18